MGFIINLKPERIDRIQKKLQRERDKEARALKSKKVKKKRKQPKRNQFDID